MRILGLFDDTDVVELQVQELVNGDQGALHTHFVFQIDGHRLTNQSLEEWIEQLYDISIKKSVHGHKEQ